MTKKIHIISAVLLLAGAVNGYCGKAKEIKPSLREFEALLSVEEKVGV